MAALKLWLLYISCLYSLAGLALSSHFRGGIIQWRPATNPHNGNIEITHRIAWRRSAGFYCDQATINARTLIGYGSLTCRSGCSGTVGSMQYYCTDFSITEDSSAGERSYTYNAAGVTSFEASFGSCCWINSLVAGGGSWELRVKGTLTTRTDTGSVNSSPVSAISPVLRLLHGCSHTIRIPVADVDGDDVRCRWAESSQGECGGVCSAFTGATLTGCNLQFPASGSAGWYAVALQIEDFASTTATVPLSSVPLQFLVNVYTSAGSCGTSTPPEFVGITRVDGSCVGVPTTYREPIIAQSASSSINIVDIVTVSPLGLTKSSVTASTTSRLWFVNITWTPTLSQSGPNVFCYYAVDSVGLSSSQSCITLLGGVQAPQLVQNSLSPTGMTTETNQWLMQFDRQFRRPTSSRFIRIYDASNTQVIAIDVSTSSSVTFPTNTSERTLSFSTTYSFTLRASYHVLLDPGVVVGTEFCGAESAAVQDPTFWTVVIGCTHGSIRLRDGSTSMNGRVEVCMNEQWGTVCDDNWEAVDANVACRQLGYSGSDAIAYSNAYFGQGTSLSIYLDDVACTTAQSRLIDCSYDSNTGDCSHSEDAGVQCVARCTHGSIRLRDSTASMNGRVEVCLNGHWGTVCDHLWTTIDANVACRQLGYSGSDATAYSNAYFGQNTNIIIALDDVACTTAQSRLIDCVYDSNTADCFHSDDAGVACVARCSHGSIRLRDGTASMNGRVEVCLNGHWGTVCDHLWTTIDANVACRQLGYSGSDATAYSNAHFGQNADIIIALDDLACTTAQTRLIDCTHDTNTGDCSHSDDAGVQCVALCAHGSIRLRDGSTTLNGRVEVCLNGHWGTVCDHLWTTIDANVACRQLGYSGSDATAYSSAHFGQNPNIIIALDDVTCTTAQSGLINCTYDSNTGDCSHSDDAGVQCVPRCSHGSIRLRDGTTSMNGRVEVCLNGHWGTVCDHLWTTIDANVACRQLGYSGSDATAYSSAHFGQNPNIIIALDDVTCTTAQSRLINCTYDSNTGDCSHSDDAGVQCVPQCSHGTIRLRNGSTSMNGRVEVCLNGDWGTVCDDGWGTIDANVACRQLGYSGSDATAYSNAHFGQNADIIIALDDLACTTAQTRLIDCTHDTNTGDCSHSDDAGVQCVALCAHGSIRLRDGSTTLNGRVEVCLNGHWGTVCDHFWATIDANVACRQLGYSGSDATAYSSAHFGHNPNIIIALDDVTCTTAQSRLIDCVYDNNTGDCSHSDDAGVQCVPRCSHGSIRLRNGTASMNGRVEVCLNGHWGTVCDHFWTTIDANVACRQLGYSGSDATAYSNAHFGQNADIIIALDDLACTTAQTRLIDCTHDTNTGDCSHSDDAAVQCVPRCSNDTIRLRNGTSSMNGRVEVCLNGDWGTVCDHFWTTIDANVACRQLGYSGSDATAYNNAHFGQDATIIIALDDLACTAYESRLIDCTHDRNTIDCSHSGDAGVRCVPRCSHGSIRLRGGTASMNGRVEVCLNGDWGTVCDDGWTTVDSNIACRQLGFSNSDSTAYTNAHFGQGSTIIIAIDDVACTGSEATIFSCTHANSHNCAHSEDAGAQCVPRCTHGTVRLVGGSYSFEGRVEVCVNGLWGTVCHDSWTSVDAAAACKYFGYSTYEVLAYGSAHFGQAQLPILLDNVACTGSELRLVDCFYDNDTSDCSHAQDSGTRCHPIPTNQSLNTQVTGSANNGEFKYYNFPFNSSGLTFRLDVFQGSVIAYASHTTESPKPQRGYNWTIQTDIYDDVFFSPASGSTVYVVLHGLQSSNTYRIGAVPEDFTTVALTAMSPVFHTLNSGVTKYYELAFPSDGVTITLDVIQGAVILYATDNIWNANAQGFDWRVAANTSSGFIEAFFDPSTLGRTACAVLFLAIVGRQSTNTYIINNAVGDIRTRVPVAPSNLQITKSDATSATVVWTAPPPNVNSPLSPITSYFLFLSEQQFSLSIVFINVTRNSHTFTGLQEFNRYTCNIAAMNSIGQGPFSSIVFNTSQAAPSSPPQGLSGFNLSSTGITISWSPPPTIDTNGVIQHYTVEVDEVWTGHRLTFYPTNTSINIGALHPYYVYQCRVAAVTVAQGPFTSNLQIVTGEDVPTAPPANLTVTAVTSRTASLSWDPPPYAGQNGIIRQYVLTVNHSDTNFFTELTTASTQLIVEGIFPFRVYLFAVAAKTIQLGPFSDEVSALLLEDEPDASPQNLNGSAINSTSLLLSWEPPPSEQKNGIIRHYIVNMTETETGDEFSLSTTDTTVIVSGLHPFYHYKCCVSAVTIGAGPYSSPVTLQTLQSVPNSPPQNFQGTAVSSRSISLNWDSPLLEDQNGIIIGYIINVTLVETEENFDLFSNSNNITVGLLRPYSTFRLKIAGQTVVGIGTFSAAITIRTPEDVPSQPRNPNVKTIVGSPTELLVTWDPPAESNGIILIYTVYYYSLHIAENQIFSNLTIQSPLDHVQVLSNETSAFLVDLTPYTFYGFQITANTSAGEGNFSLFEFNITDESVPADPPASFNATAINSTAILLSWSEPSTPYGIVVSYNITFSRVPTDVGSEINGHNQSINYTEPSVSLQVDAGDGNSVLVTGLNEYTLYVFEIFASTRIGSGPSAWETARTHHTHPHAPPQNIQISVTSSRTMVVSWNSPPSEDQNGIIIYYLLLITQEQFNISDRVINTTSNATSYIVANLEEYNNYTCRVAAATRIGPGPYSAPIYFNTPEDAPSAPPQSLSGTFQGSRSIALTWSPPPPIHINGVIEKYVVKVTERETEQTWTFFAFDGDILVGSLHPHYHYDCRVAAFTTAEGVLSSIFTVQTEEEPPSVSPSSLVVFGATHDSLSLSWQALPFAETNGVIRGYTIAVHEVETGRDFTVYSNTTQVTLEHLHPFYTYTCRIAAETVGRGPFSEYITIQLPEAAPASPPTNITGHAVDSTTIVLTWSPPQPRDQNGIIRNYTISVSEQNTGRQFTLVSDDTHETLRSLRPSYTYIISIRAVTIGGGPYSTQIALQTEDYFPSVAPGNVTIAEITSHSVYLTWIPPPVENQNGIISGYLINITVAQTGEMFQHFSNTTSTTIILMPFTTYTFVLTAENSAGIGPYTEIFSVQTEEAAPTSPPRDLATTAVGPDSISLAWLPPPTANQNGIIREYRLNITEVETERELYFSTIATSITVPLLHPHYTYECIISAYTIGTGPSAEIVVMTREDAPSGSPQNLTANNISSRSAILNWNPPLPVHQNGNITAYIINASVVGSGETLQFVSDSTLLELDTLAPYTTYSFVIAASTSVGMGPFSIEVVIQTQEEAPTSPPLSPTGAAVNSRSVALSWNPPPPEDQNGILRFYTVNIAELETGRIIQHTTPTTSLQVPLLHPYYTYQWKVSAYTVREGPYTNISTVTTPEDAPSAAPQNLVAHFNATSHDSTFLSWDPLPFTERNGVVLGYVVNLTDIGNGSNIQLHSESHNLTVNFLRPYTTYTCIVAAYTSVETGPFSAEISVQTQETSPGDNPTNATGMALNSTYIYLSWDHPPEEFHHGVIRHYLINITEVETGRTFQLTSEQTEITIGKLHPHYIYHCAIAAVTVAEGPSVIVTVRTEEDAPSGTPTNFQVTADTTRSLVLSWEPPFSQHQNGIVRLYIVTIALNSTAQVNNFSTTANTIRVTTLIKPFRTYLCSVVAVTIAVGPFTEDVAVHTPQDTPETPPLQFRVEATDSRTLVLSWEPPNSEYQNGIITNYTVIIAEMETGIVHQNVTGNTSFTAFPQHPYYTYNCSVAARTSEGLGPFTLSRAVQMPEDAPSSAPSGVHFNMITSSGFTLMWNAPPPENHNGVIRHYAIHIIEVATGIEYTLTSVMTQKTIDFLHPYYNYSCTLSAVTNHLGPSSAAINITTAEDEPNGPPNNAIATSENSTSIIIIWEPPSPEYRNGIIIGYTINLMEVGSGDVSQHNSSGDNITIGSLSPFTTYNFTVAAQTRVGTGPYTTTSTVMTSEDAPSAPPMDVNHTQLTSNSVVLQWSPPPAQHLNGIIRAYNVVVYELETGQSNSLISSQNELSIGSANLQPFYWYNFSVCAVTVAQGPCTDMYSLQTLEDIPSGPPLSFQATPVNSTSLQLNWEPPARENRNGIIRKYLINATALESGEHFQWLSITTSLVVSGLHPHYHYNLIIAAITTGPSGPFSDVHSVLTPEDVPNGTPTNVSVEVLTSSSIRITWRPPQRSQQYGEISGYTIKFTSLQNRYMHIYNVPGNASSHTIEGLQGYSEFQVAVAAQTAVGTGPYFMVPPNKTLESVPGAPEGITYHILTDTIVQLYWNPPDNPNGIIRSYQVIYHGYRLNQTGVPETVLNVLVTTNASVTNLVTGLTYEFKIRARTTVGYGENSSIVLVELHAVSTTEENSTPVSNTKDIIRTTIITSVSVLAGMIWIALCCMLPCVIYYRRKKRTEQHDIVEYNIPTFGSAQSLDFSEIYTNTIVDDKDEGRNMNQNSLKDDPF